MFTVYESEQTHSLLILIWGLNCLHWAKAKQEMSRNVRRLGQRIQVRNNNSNNNDIIQQRSESLATADHHRRDRSPKASQGQGPARQPNIIMAKFGPDNIQHNKDNCEQTQTAKQTYKSDRPCGIFSTLEIGSSFGCQANSAAAAAAAAPLLQSR